MPDTSLPSQVFDVELLKIDDPDAYTRRALEREEQEKKERRRKGRKGKGKSKTGKGATSKSFQGVNRGEVGL